QIVADGQADLDAERGLDRSRGRVTRRHLLGLAVARAVGDVDVEQVQLAVCRHDLASRRDQRRGVVDPAASGARVFESRRELRDRSGQTPDGALYAELADARELRPLHEPCESVFLTGRPAVL